MPNWIVAYRARGGFRGTLQIIAASTEAEAIGRAHAILQPSTRIIDAKPDTTPERADTA